jgi:SHS2 domain-containing protein
MLDILNVVRSVVFRYLDHMSDVYVQVSSPTLEGIFNDAAKATFEVMIDTSTVKPTILKEVELDADDLEQLLYKWIDHLLYLFDAESFAVSKAESRITKQKGQLPALFAKIFGDAYDPATHGQRVAVKAMTYSLMRLHKAGEGWEAYFVLDI